MAGDWLRANVPAVDAVLCSPATRTRQTLAATGITAPVEVGPRIYLAEVDTLIDLIRLVDDEVNTLLLVGHAPGMPGTAWELAANRHDDHTQRLARKFPTSAIAVLRFDRPWRDIHPGSGDLVAFHVPR